jgi:signal transduction histidine kinase/ActR/RegA family two-component response regulator
MLKIVEMACLTAAGVFLFYTPGGGAAQDAALGDKWVAGTLFRWLTGASGLTLFVAALVYALSLRYKREGKRLERTRYLVRQDGLLRAINDAAALLLTPDESEFEDALRDGMARMGSCVDVDRIYVWKNSMENGVLTYTQVSEWTSGAVEARSRVSGEKMTFSYTESIPEWEAKLSAGQSISGMVKDLSPTEQERLKPYGIRSLLVVPVRLRDRFWGFVSFDKCREERAFSEDEVSILRSGSLLLANVMVRNEMTRNLLRAREEAISSAKAKSNFLSAVSHEMRTPLSAVIGMTAIGKSAASLEKKDYAFEKIGDASTHLLSVINDILDMSKIEANKLELFSAEFSLEKTLRKAIDIVHFRMEDKQQNFTVNIDENIPDTLIGDDQRLTQVVANLLSNAVKFTPEQGSLRLDARLLKEKENGACTLQVEVTDTGIGIAPEQQAKLFSPFQQAESGISRKFGGTGLGLAISKRIVEMMGGKIWIKSKLGKGSTFIFTLQVRRGAKNPNGLSAPAAGAGDSVRAGETNCFDGRRVLLAEDVEINREIVQTLLEPTGLEIDCAEDGAKAVEMFSADPCRYDLIFMDVQMPEVDGCEAARRIRALGVPGAKTVPIVAMTANVFKEDIEKCLESGMDSHLGKPLDFDEVLKTLRQYLLKPARLPDRREGAFSCLHQAP